MIDKSPYFEKTKTLRFWVQHTLPLVYDDSLSYYELLSKVVDKVNILIDNNNKLPDFVVEMIKEQIRNIDNLEEIIKEVLKEMLDVDYYTKSEVDLLLLDLKNTINGEFEDYYNKTETDEKYVTVNGRYLERNGDKVNRTLHVEEPRRRHIDAINGDDNNDGLTASTAFKTLDRFFDECNLCSADIRAFLHNPTNGTIVYPFTKRVFTSVCFHLSAFYVVVDAGTENERRVYDENIIVQPASGTTFPYIIGYNCRFNIDHFKLECGLATDNCFVTMNQMEIDGHTQILGGHLTLNSCIFDTLELRYSIGNTSNMTFNNKNHYNSRGEQIYPYALDIHQGSSITQEGALIINTLNDQGNFLRIDESTYIDRSTVTNNTSFNKPNMYLMQSLWRSSDYRYRNNFTVTVCTESSIQTPSELAVDLGGTLTFNDVYVNGSIKPNGRSVVYTMYSSRSLINATTLTATDVKASIRVMKNVPTSYTIAGQVVSIPVTTYGYVGTTTGVVDWIKEGVVINTVKKDNHHFDMEIGLPTDSEIVPNAAPVIFFDALTIQIA